MQKKSSNNLYSKFSGLSFFNRLLTLQSVLGMTQPMVPQVGGMTSRWVTGLVSVNPYPRKIKEDFFCKNTCVQVGIGDGGFIVSKQREISNDWKTMECVYTICNSFIFASQASDSLNLSSPKDESTKRIGDLTCEDVCNLLIYVQ